MSEYLDLHALADGQLDGEAKRAAEDRLSCCAKSRAEYEAVCSLKQVLQSKCESTACDDAWRQCQGRLQEVRSARRVESFVGKYSWGLCGVFLLAIVVGGSINRGTGGSVRTGDVARVSASLSPLSLPSAQSPADRRKWFQDVMSGPMVDSSETLQIVGGASGMMNGHKVVRVNLVDSIGPMAFFELHNVRGIEDAHQEDSGFAACQMNGTNGVTWVRGQHSYLLVGNRPIDDLVSVAKTLRGR